MTVLKVFYFDLKLNKAAMIQEINAWICSFCSPMRHKTNTWGRPVNRDLSRRNELKAAVRRK